jgi:zinc transport system substrate-binding protein
MRIPAAVVTMVLALAVTGACGTHRAFRDDGRLHVVAAFGPLFEAAARVGGERVTVVNLTPAGAEPHDLELASDDVDRVEDADLVVYVGGGFQPAVGEVAARTSGRAVDVVSGDAGGDPHVWLDPVRFAGVVDEIRDALVAVDPSGADAYRANAAAYVAQISAVDAAFASGLRSCERRQIISAHDAFGLLAARYDLDARAIAGRSPEIEPDPARLADLAEAAKRDGVRTIFTEALVSPEVAQTLAREAGVTTAVLDPVEGLGGGRTYASVMRANLTALRRALGCS